MRARTNTGAVIYAVGDHAINVEGTVLSDTSILGATKVVAGERGGIALKIIEKSQLYNCDELAQARSEITLHQELSLYNHTHIIPLMASEETDTQFLLITPLADEGDLWKVICYGQCLPESEVRNFAAQLLDGLSCMHSAQICHSDIKPQNILVFRVGRKDEALHKHKLVARLIDFGLSKRLPARGEKIQHEGLRGSTGYYAPEMFQRRDYDAKIDIWAAGIIVFRMLVGYEPFYPATSYAEAVDFDERYWGHISCECRDFIQKLLTLDPNRRPGAAEALKHCWFSEANCLREDGQPRKDSGIIYRSPMDHNSLRFHRLGQVPDNLLPPLTQQYLTKRSGGLTRRMVSSVI